MLQLLGFRAASFGSAASIVSSMAGFNGFGGGLLEIKLMIAGALAAVLIPSAHEIKDRLTAPHPALAAGAALIAAYCILEVGRGAPLNFIYFQF